MLAITTAKKHIIVLFKAHIFKLDIVNEQGAIYSFSEIEAAFKQIMATTRQGQNIGVLTTMERDAWAEGEQMGMTTLPNIFTDSGYQTLTHSVVCTSTTAE